MSKNYRPGPVAIAVLSACAGLAPASAHAAGTLKIFLMAGQSNTVGHARTFYEGPALTTSPYRMEYLADSPAFVAGLDANIYSFKDHFEAN